MIGTQIGNYKIKEFIASGGMSNVYLAIDLSCGKEVAIKILKKSYTNDNEYIEKYFNREIKITKSLNHPNIIKLLDYGKHAGNYYLVYEYVSGTTLSKYISRNKPSISQIETIAESILNALSYAHSRGIIHRDVKPQNILLSSKGEIKITDFGIAKAIASSTITNTGLFLGSPGYISPEQADPDILRGQEIDCRSDIYSFGVLLFELLTGRLPFISDTPWGIVNKHLKEEPPDVRQLDSSIPGYLSYIVLKCLQKDRNKRFSNANEIIRVLKLKNAPDASVFYAGSGPSPSYVYQSHPSFSNVQTVYKKPGAGNVYAAEKAQGSYGSSRASFIYSHFIPLWKIILFTIITLGTYNYYWYYRNWRNLREVSGTDIKPGLRTLGLLVPILGWILIYNQYKDIRNLVYNETGNSFSAGGMLALHIVFNILARIVSIATTAGTVYTAFAISTSSANPYALLLTYLFTSLYLIPMAIVQKNFNIYWGKIQSGLKIRHRLTVGEIILLCVVLTYFIIYRV